MHDGERIPSWRDICKVAPRLRLPHFDDHDIRGRAQHLRREPPRATRTARNPPCLCCYECSESGRMPGQAAWAVTETGGDRHQQAQDARHKGGALLYSGVLRRLSVQRWRRMLCVHASLPSPKVYASLFFHDNDRRWKTAGGSGVNRPLLMLLLRLGHSR